MAPVNSQRTIDERHTTHVKPPSGFPTLELGEVWRNRDIVLILAVRDIKVRYKQSFAGISWAIIQPLLTMIVFTAVFAGVVEVTTHDAPYPLFSLAALVPWSYFVHAITKATSCLVTDQNLITRVYFPRLVLPISAVVGGLVDFFIAFALLVILLVIYGSAPTLKILLLPFFLLFTILTALALSLWLSAINVQYRDVNNALPFFSQVLMFVSPVAYPASSIPEKWQLLYALNPMATVINGFRWALLENQPGPGIYSLVSVAVVLIALFGGLYFFRWQEDRFADVV
ncbi:MAG: ABC transporter permease [Xanthomonadales bacterium]|jgi:lipopolysaccharide transport system permease protein|nr:ABC transporter permease [Xanthomonadales bacterium]MDH3942306.1 ABC transporter permease [Xanthomonadales bacterium]MDH4002252.1 ABC transporter permease [Xanthomonadales bacterium]